MARLFVDRQPTHLIDPFSPGIQSIAEAAARKGVKLDLRLLPLAGFSDEEAAAAVGAEIGQIVRTVVCVAPRAGGGLIPLVCLISGRNRLEIDLLRAVTGEREVWETSDAGAQALFGQFAGGMPPFGHGPGVRTVMDESLGRYEWLWAPAGADSTFMRIAPGTLRMLSNAVVAPVAQPSWMQPPDSATTRFAALQASAERAERLGKPAPEGGE